MIFKYTKFNPISYESHMLVYDKVREKSKVLDVGCATGYFAKKLKEKDCKVWGIEQNPEAAKIARKYCEKVVVADIESSRKLPLSEKFFDYILFLDLLEHLRDPAKVLSFFTSYLAEGGYIIISAPNVAHISIRTRLLMGKFNYEKLGIMDETHLRFFTKSTLIKMIENSGLEVQEIDYSSDLGQLPALSRITKHIPKILQYKITRLFDTLLAVQFIVLCKKN